MDINYLAVIAAALSAFLLGSIWYGPLFGRKWRELNEIWDDEKQEGHPARVFGGAFVFSLISAFVFAMFLGRGVELGFAVGVGFAAGFAWVASSFGINYLFAGKRLGLWLIDGGYHTLQFTLYGLILGLWQ